MADSEVLSVLREVAIKIQTASLNERREVFVKIQDLLLREDVKESTVRFICRLLLHTLHRYRDSASRSLVTSLIALLCKKHECWTLKNFPPVLLEVTECLKNIVPSKNTSRTGLYALAWLSTLVQSSTSDEDWDYTCLVTAQAYLLSSVVIGGDQKLTAKGLANLHSTWKSLTEERRQKWFQALLALPEPQPAVAVTLSVMCQHYTDIGQREKCLQHKTKLLEVFTKSLISVKNRPNVHNISLCAALLGLLNKADVKDVLIPTMHKAILRSPEVIIEAVSEVFNNINLELNDVLLDIGKSLIGNLHSKDESVGRYAVCSVSAIAHCVSEAQTALTLLRYVFLHYHGEGGKLAATQQKISVLDGAAALSGMKLEEEAREKLCTEALTQLSKILECESHEKTVCAALNTLMSWSTPKLCDQYVQMFKKNLNLKSCTPPLRIAYMRYIASVVKQAEPTDKERDAMWSILIKSQEKAIQQPLQQQSVNEAICAMQALVQLDRNHELCKHAAVWNALTNKDKLVLLHDRSLQAATADVLLQVVVLCRNVIEKYSPLPEESPLFKALAWTLLSSNKSVRSAAIENVKGLLNGGNRGHIARHLLGRLTMLLEEGKFLGKEKSPSEENTHLDGKIILDSVNALCSCADYPKEDLELLAVNSLPCYHNPLAMAANHKAWLSMVKRLQLLPMQLVYDHRDVLISTYIHGFKANNETMSNIVSRLVAVNSIAILPSLVDLVIRDISDPSLLKVTRDEYFVYLTPEGELYDKSVVPGNDNNNEMNMKRESKAYSYKEQLEELQLRRELEDRKRKQGKSTETPLSAKQKEAIKTQLAKEATIRQRLSELYVKVSRSCGLTVCAMRGSQRSLSLFIRPLWPRLLRALRSPLSAPPVAAVALELRSLLRPHFTQLADTVAHVILRLHNPQCDLDGAWDEVPIEAATSNAIEMLQETVTTSKILHRIVRNDADDEGIVMNLTGPHFCYVFPLINNGLTMFHSKLPDRIIISALRLVSHYSAMRGANERDAYHPIHLPIDHMFKMLLELRSVTKGRILSNVMGTLLDVAACVSGAAGCYRARFEEVDVLLTGLQHPMEAVRDSALCALQCIETVLPDMLVDEEMATQILRRLLLAKFDVVERNRELGEKLCEELMTDELRDKLWQHLLTGILSDLQHPAEEVQRAAAQALAYLLADRPDITCITLDAILDAYREKLTLVPAQLDQFGHEQTAAVDEWGGRRGCGLALSAMAELLKPTAVLTALTFFVQEGLNDRDERVRAEMLNAAMLVVEIHGKETISIQLPVFEEFLDKAPKSSAYDAVRQSVVLLVGSLARHLEKDDARLRPITLRLIASLNTPSEQVQDAVSNCLPHLVTSPALKDEIPTIINKLMKQLVTAEKFGERKGAAYGIAGVIRGLGILSLKNMDLMARLTECIQEKKNYKNKEGALFALEMLCQKLGRLFEPYVVHILPHLLLCFGDTSQYVRTAADVTAKLIMSKLSAHGVKLVLPALLEALQEENWRTKAGSVELLGTMAFCSPKQLSSCLPSIVPKLIEVLSDSHMKVQAAGVESLGVIGSVIRNPEIQAIVPVLLQALQDPSNKTSLCLQTLLDTKFVHFIDAPSLALIMPVVQRALMDRSTETRKMAAQIIGNMYSLTDQKDLAPYVSSILPGLKASLIDPVPEVRSVSARALGAMVRGMGESTFEHLLPWLMGTLTSEASSVDRSGAAQGLSEVVAALGTEKLHSIMPEIITTSERSDIAPHVKDGYIMMFIYMPTTFQVEFTTYIGRIINPILKALADENEYVRETALRAGQRIVNLYAESAITLLLPQLERGLFDDNWRIRYSSVQLLGDLLYRISGVTGKMSTETASDDDNFGTEQSHRAIMRTLGGERRNRVLAGLYMGRSDVALMVRQSALHVWKVVVTNTPKTLREILPTLFGLLLGCLASTSYDKRQVAARTLGDLVRKLGERVLPEIVPILERGLESDRSDQRQGVCIGLGEIVSSTSRDTVMTFADGLVPTVRKALCDPLPEVRLAAAKTFDSLHATIGSKALDDTLPHLLAALGDPDTDVAEAALDGLRQVMALKSRAVLPYLVPQLTARKAGDTRALAALATAAGDALGKYLHKILPALLSALDAAHNTEYYYRELEQCRDACLPVTDEAGVRCVCDTLLEATRSPEELRKRSATSLLCTYISHTKADLAPHVPQLLRGLMLLMAYDDRAIVTMAWDAMTALIRAMDSDRQISHISDIRHAVKYAACELKGELMPGFCVPKGIAPLLPIFRESILNGEPEDKENAALMLGEVLKLTSAEALQSSVIQVTGPLIRILGDRFSASVKAAVLETLTLLLAKVGVMLKQFLPQLQTSFLKSLNDPSRPVRIRAGCGLAKLVCIHSRADALFTEMLTGLRSSEDIRDTTLQALRGTITAGGCKMSGQMALSLLTSLTAPSVLGAVTGTGTGSGTGTGTMGAAGCLGAMLHALPQPHRAAAFTHHVLQTEPGDPLLAARSAALFVALKETPQHLYPEHTDQIHAALLFYLAADKAPVVCNGVRGVAYLFLYLIETDCPVPHNILQQFIRGMNHSSNEVKQLTARTCSELGKQLGAEKIPTEVLRGMLPALVNGTKEKNAYVRADAELALRALLKLKDTNDAYQYCLSVLDEGAREALSDVVSRTLRRPAADIKDDELDNTLVLT